MTFLNVPTQPLLEIPHRLHLAAWQNRSASAPAWWNTYLNQVCLQTVLPWLGEYDAVHSPLDQSALQASWQLVNGTAVTLADDRVILIPDKTVDQSEFRVPQEWVDLPSWAGDYYIAAQVNSDDASVLVWGYTTHEQLKTKGRYDSHDRTYCLDAEDLIQDFAVFAVARAVCRQEVTRAEIAPIAPVPATQAETLLHRLADRAIFHPRLEIPFQLWGALLEQPQWRQQLGQRRLELSSMTSAATVANTISTSAAHLSQWLQNTFEEGWQSLDSLLGREPSLAYSFRQTSELAQPTAQRVKVLNLGERTIWLSVALEPSEDDRIAVRASALCGERGFVLPPDLSLTLRSNSGSVVQSVVARDRDDVIQLNRFRCAIGTQFSLQISLDQINLTEDFTV